MRKLPQPVDTIRTTRLPQRKENDMSDRRERDALAFELQNADPEPYDGYIGAPEYYRQFAQKMLANRKKGEGDD